MVKFKHAKRGATFLFFIMATLFFYVNLKAQQDVDKKLKKSRLIVTEGSMDSFFPQVPDYGFIRGDILPYHYSNVTPSLRGTAYRWNIGIKTELRSKNDLWGFVTGFKYSRLICAIGKDSYFNNPSNFFYFLDFQSGLSTNYLRVKEINREMDYLGIPFEIRRFGKLPIKSRYYLKLGAEVNLLVNKKSSVTFYNANLQNQENLVLSRFEKPAQVFSTIYLSGGFNFDFTVQLDFELILPYFIITPNNTGLLKLHSGVGFKVSVGFPY